MNAHALSAGIVARSILRLSCLLAAVFAAVAAGAGDAGSGPRMPMLLVETNAATFRWLQKPVPGARLLDDMESTNRWTHLGNGTMSFTTERARDGRQAVRLVAPTKTAQANRVSGRPFGEAAARRTFEGEDWRKFNRLSVWVYPTAPGFHNPSLLIKLNNAGADKVPDRYGREGLHYAILKPDQWNQVVFEIPHLARDNVTGVDLIYRLQGNEPNATNVVCYDFDRLELQRVEPDYFEGWAPAPGRIAYSQSGYALDATKTAVCGLDGVNEFTVVQVADGQAVLHKPIVNFTSALGAFRLMDFSEVREPGRYRLQAGKAATEPFLIHERVWRDTVWKTINLYYCERCGDAIRGVHDVCHRDWTARHAERRIVINGGWHDAGDLSQGLVNTAEATLAMLELAETLASTDAPLAQRLLEEARWGLDWMLKTRFGDGARVTWATMDFWTDGVMGNADDVFGDVRTSPFDNFVGAATEAVAGRVLAASDRALSRRCLKAAEEDWNFAAQKTASPGLELSAAGLVAAVELYQATRQQRYADQAYEFAGLVMQCQQREWPEWTIPMTGFFYTSPKRDRILHYTHRGHEQAPIVGLAELCRLFPKHPDWMKWYSAVALHSEYLRRAAAFNAPWEMLSASIYSLDESKDATFRQQVLKGIKLSDRFFLRRFPVWFDFRGNHGTVLSQTKALSTAARLRQEPRLADLCQRQLEWVVGRSPFARSTMYGEGHDYLPQYTAMSGDIAGGLPVGIQTRANEDTPYWPAANCYNYAEIWVHPSSRWLWIQCDLAKIAAEPARSGAVRDLAAEPKEDGRLTLRARFRGQGTHRVSVRTSNLQVDGAVKNVNVAAGESSALEWAGRIISPKEPWLAVIVVDGEPPPSAEVSGGWK